MNLIKVEQNVNLINLIKLDDRSSVEKKRGLPSQLKRKIIERKRGLPSQLILGLLDLYTIIIINNILRLINE